MATIFSRIAAGEIGCYKVAEDDRHFAFLDINPVAAGHVLVIPKKEVDYIFDLEEDEYADLQKFARRVAIAMRHAIPHAHIHLVPINAESDMNFFKQHPTIPDTEMEAIAKAISTEFEKI